MIKGVDRVLVLGATGLLGQAVMAEAHQRGLTVRGAARRGADVEVDIADEAALGSVLTTEQPTLVFNCVALVDVAACEYDPGLAYRINAAPLRALAAWSSETGGRLVHISTDHFFAEGSDRAHREDEPVTLLNQYAATKYAAEHFALTAPSALVLRTSIVGVRGWSQPTFAEWALRSVLGDESMTLFNDAFTSSIDTHAFARAALDLTRASATGLLNVGASEVYSKEAFVRLLARELGRTLTRAVTGTVGALIPPRPASLGLDIRRAQALLAWPLPDLRAVVRGVIEQYRGREAT